MLVRSSIPTLDLPHGSPALYQLSLTVGGLDMLDVVCFLTFVILTSLKVGGEGNLPVFKLDIIIYIIYI